MSQTITIKIEESVPGQNLPSIQVLTLDADTIPAADLDAEILSTVHRLRAGIRKDVTDKQVDSREPIEGLTSEKSFNALFEDKPGAVAADQPVNPDLIASGHRA